MKGVFVRMTIPLGSQFHELTHMVAMRKVFEEFKIPKIMTTTQKDALKQLDCFRDFEFNYLVITDDNIAVATHEIEPKMLLSPFTPISYELISECLRLDPLQNLRSLGARISCVTEYNSIRAYLYLNQLFLYLPENAIYYYQPNNKLYVNLVKWIPG